MCVCEREYAQSPTYLIRFSEKAFRKRMEIKNIILTGFLFWFKPSIAVAGQTQNCHIYIHSKVSIYVYTVICVLSLCMPVFLYGCLMSFAAIVSAALRVFSGFTINLVKSNQWTIRYCLFVYARVIAVATCSCLTNR